MGPMILPATSTRQRRPWAVVLAAGASRRYGRPKLLCRIDGESLLRRAARIAAEACDGRCIVVLGARAERLGRELSGLPVRVAVNRRWRTGLASSLRTGIAALPPQASGALLLLADQATVDAVALGRLLRAFRHSRGRLVASRYNGITGPPAVIGRRWFTRLRRLRGDAGARELLRDASLPVTALELATGANDVDRPGDLAALRSRARRSFRRP